MPDYGITTGLPQLPALLGDEKSFAQFKPVYQAINSLSQGISTSLGLVDFSQAELQQRNQLASILTQQHRKLYVLNNTGVALAFGKVVNLYLSSGKIAAQLADATDNTKPALGVVNNALGIDPGLYGEVVIGEGYSQGIGGTTLGAIYYLSTAGNVQLARPGAVGSIVQAVGFGLGSAGFYLDISLLFLQN
jgi:hypothetical protein